MIDPAAMIHPRAEVDEGATVGRRTQVWQFAIILAGARVGAECNINCHTFVEGGATIGDRVTVKAGVYVWDGVTLEDDVFCGPNATFTNDKHPRSRQRPAEFAKTLVRKGASIGAGAVILPGVTIGECATIGAGAVVTGDVPAGETWVGNPAKALG
jgi:UDP-2-acetamido-3-amino-2,3-dideoxy-glucuronate N-acetyltransferase